MPEKKELRRHARRPAEGMTVTCYRTQGRAAYVPRKNIGEAILDISAGGCRLRVNTALEVGAPLTIELRETASGDVFHAHGTVRWVQSAAAVPTTTHIVGVQFLEIFTPFGKREKFLLGPAALQATPGMAPAPAGDSHTVVRAVPSSGPISRAVRFKIDDYVVTAFKSGLLSSVGLRKNVALSVVDLSRTGCQFVSSEQLVPGTRITFTLHLNKFADTFETEAEVVWVREGKDATGQTTYMTGIQFGGMAPAKQKLVDYMMSWFTSYQAKYRQERRGPSEGRRAGDA